MALRHVPFQCQMMINPLPSGDEGWAGFIIGFNYLDPLPEIYSIAGVEDRRICQHCHGLAAVGLHWPSKCAACKTDCGVAFRYCSGACQLLDWPLHKKVCPNKRDRRLMEAALVTCERRGLSPHRIGWFRSARTDGPDRRWVWRGVG